MSGSATMVDVVIIGGGISGLCAARLLRQEGLSVVVLEARDRVGGRTYTLQDPAYGYTDLGGAYIGPSQRRIARLIRELGLEFYKVYHKEQKTLTDIKGFRARYKGKYPPIMNPIEILDMNDTVRRLNDMAKQVPVEAPWKAPHAREWDSVTFQQYLDTTTWTKMTQIYSTLMVQALVCAEPHEVSLLSMLWYINSGGGLERMTQITQGAQELKIVGGAQQVSDRMADDLGESVKLNETVVSVDQTLSNSKVKVMTNTGQTYEADYVISAMPQTLLNRVTFTPPLLAMKSQMSQRLPMGSIIKTIMFYDKAFWRDQGFNGEMSTDKGPVKYCIDDTKPDGSHPAIMGFVLADQARKLTLLTPEERKNQIARHYATVFRCEDFLKPVNYVELNWMAEEYSGGCYVSYFPPGVLSTYGGQLRQEHGRVYFAGTETATAWVGYMDGAIEAGERAARQVLCEMGKISSDEIYTEEPESPQFPDNPIELDWIEKVLPSVRQFLSVCTVIGVVFVACLVNYCIRS